MSEEEKKEEETPEPNPRRIDMRALERGVRKALEIRPKDQKGKEKGKKAPQQDSNLHLTT